MSASAPLQPAQQAPDFKATAVVNGVFEEVSLSDYKGKYVVLFFYPMDFTFVCPTEIIAFSERAEEFRKIGCEVNYSILLLHLKLIFACVLRMTGPVKMIDF